MKSEINDSSVQLQQSIQKLNELVANLTASFQPITTIAKDIVKPFEGIAHKVPVESIVSSGSRIAEQIQKETQAFQTTEIYKNITGTLGTLIRTMDLHQYGLFSREIVALIENGKLERVKQGLYRLPMQAERDSEEKLISQLYPDGVLTLMSALYYYGYIDRLPLAWDIAVSRNTSKSRFNIDYPYVQPHYMEDAHLQYGVSTAVYSDCVLSIFDRDRLICECIKHENKMERETFNKAIISYINDSQKNITNLLDYAKRRNIHKKVRTRMEVWL